jgi:hypothetical protein
MGGTAVDTVQ